MPVLVVEVQLPDDVTVRPIVTREVPVILTVDVSTVPTYCPAHGRMEVDVKTIRERARRTLSRLADSDLVKCERLNVSPSGAPQR